MSAEAREHGLMGPILAASLFGMTRSMPLITTVHTSILHPVHVVRIGANLDTLSRWRWGINPVTGSGGADGLFGALQPAANRCRTRRVKRHHNKEPDDAYWRSISHP